MRKYYVNFVLLLLCCFGEVGSAQPAKLYETYTAESLGGLCSQTVRLFNDSTYCFERGCEASSHFSLGKWKIRKDTLLFYPVQPAGYRVIDTVIARRTNDKKIIVSLFDRSRINITGRVLAMHYVKNIGFYDMPTDSTNQFRSDVRRRDGAIVLKPLQRLFQQRLLVPVDSINNQYEIRLNLSAEWLFQPASDWTDISGFKLLKRKDQLVSPRPDQPDDKGVLRPTVFVKRDW
jgi:hypothetical protein